jgi:virulence-associated protein VapD
MAKKHKIFVFSIIILLLPLLAEGAYLSLGWLRNTVVPGYVSLFYKGEANAAFNKAFPPITKELNTYGITFNDGQFHHSWCSTSYEGFSESVYCDRDIQNDGNSMPQNFISHWQQDSPSLEAYLLSHGWHKEYDAHQDIAKLFNGNAGGGVNYSKSYGKTECSLMLGSQSMPTQITVTEACVRNVAFFHGEQG